MINLEIKLEKNAYIVDSSKTYLVGEVSQLAKRLVQTAYEAMWRGIQTVRSALWIADLVLAWIVRRDSPRRLRRIRRPVHV